jgi:hypothetical protein
MVRGVRVRKKRMLRGQDRQCERGEGGETRQDAGGTTAGTVSRGALQDYPGRLGVSLDF